MARKSLAVEVKKNVKENAAKLSPDAVVKTLRSGKRNTPRTTDWLCKHFAVSEGEALKVLGSMYESGYLVHLVGKEWHLDNAPIPKAEPIHEYKSRPDGTYLFGALGDCHLGSKYERLDVLNSLYDVFAEEGVDRVYHTGNWIDGEARFNKHDLHVHGMDEQIQYLAEKYPRKDGIVTYAVAGDDHEGWYGQREGVDIGKRAEQTFRDNGRNDWRHIGFMEAFVSLVHAKSKASSQLLVQHPGGGSAYALSYTMQKIVESLDGGEKPAVLLCGHYHKLWFGNIRNVWCVQTGAQQDQTPFMRKKRISAHVGGCIVRLTQDPKTGAIVRCRVEIMRYFNKGYYNNRWSHAGAVELPVRGFGLEDE